MADSESKDNHGQLWGGRFKTPADPALLDLSRSPLNYFRMAPYDIAGSRAHAGELARAGILKNDELGQILETLDTLEEEFKKGEIAPEQTDEDLHGFLERLLIARLGTLGGKLRSGRSRNDQTANDLKLYLRDNTRHLTSLICDLQEALMLQAGDHTETPAPGFTHLQPAQPIVFGHQILAHAQAIARDIDRLQDWDRRAACSPLGAAALAGSAVAVHPELSAKELGYETAYENSIDAVASRDHVAEFLFATGMFGVNLSRLAEEIVSWSSKQFNWIVLSDAFATGSSIMPQKKNPDIAELTRGKSGRLLGNLNGMLATMKSLPLAYNRDLMEDKAAVLDTVDTLCLVVPAMTGMIKSFTVNTDEMAGQATTGFTLATEVADWLSFNGVPFNESHEIAGSLVQLCESKDQELDQVSDADLTSIDPRLTPDIRRHLTVEAALNARTGKGSTSPTKVREQLESLRGRTVQQRNWADSYKGPRA